MATKLTVDPTDQNRDQEQAPPTPPSTVHWHEGQQTQQQEGMENNTQDPHAAQKQAKKEAALQNTNTDHDDNDTIDMHGVNIDIAELGLEKVNQDTVRALLDPTRPEVNPFTAFDWSDERLEQLIAVLQPQHLAVLVRKRSDQHLEQPAKTLSWHNLTYKTHSGVTLLDNVNGYVLPGMLIGMLGAPDAGITPLLQVLAGEPPHFGKLQGEILYDSRERIQSYRKDVGFAVKQDSHLAHLTVYETLFFSARLRLPDVIPDKIVATRVKMVMKLLGISHTANTPVGDALLRGISGGEKRRLGFGLEMVAGHSVLLADLPTNGLDSATAFALIKTMRYACRGGFSLFASLVQPSFELYLLLDRVYLMSKGKVIYFGPPTQAEAFCRSHGFVRPPNKSVPQFLEELSAKPEQFWRADMPAQVNDSFYQPPASTQATDTSVEQANTGKMTARRQAWSYVVSRYESDNLYKQVLADLESIKAGKEVAVTQLSGVSDKPAKSLDGQPSSITRVYSALDKQVVRDKSTSKPGSAVDVPAWAQHRWPMNRWYDLFNAGPYMQFRENLRRQVILTYRNYGLWRDIWILAAVVGIIIGSLFWQLKTNEQGVRDRVGLFFFIISYIGFNAVQLVPVLHIQREVYYEQRTRGYYQTFAYYFTLALVQLPIVFFEALLLLVPIWGLSGLNGVPLGGSFWYAYIQIFLNSYISRTWMFVLYAGSPNEVYADVLNQVTNIVFTKLCGYFIPRESINMGWRWMYDVSYFTYSLYGLCINDVCPLTVKGCTGVAVPGTPDNPCPYDTGSASLYGLYNMACYSYKWDFVADSVYFWLTFNLAGFLLFWFVDWQQHDVPEFPNFGEYDREEDEKIGGELPDDQTLQVAVENPATALGSRSPSRSRASLRRPLAAENSRNEALNQGSLRRLAGPRIPNVRAASDIVMDVSEMPPEERAAYAAANATSNDRSLSRASQSSMRSSQASYYSHRVRYVDTQSTQQPVHGATIEWLNLKYDVPVKSESGSIIQRRLLNNVYGYCTPGMMVALMGATGAGKSTLLDVLAGNKTGGKITGTLLINGKVRDETFSHLAGYVEQFDSHNPFSTVREAIYFSGRLRLPATVTDAELEKRVDDVLDTLGLQALQNDLIGGAGLGGVSQEIRKKVTIGVELIMDPKLLFLDEPTTGLDSAGAYAVMTAVRLLARKISVICTIHQPSAEIVGMFDWLLLMRPGGFVVYFGKMKFLPVWFKKHNVGVCPPEKNIADFALEQVKRVDSFYVQNMEKGKKKDDDDKKDDKKADEPQAHFGAESGIELEEQKSKEGEVVTLDLAAEFLNSEEGQDTITKLEKGFAPRDAPLDPDAHVSQLVRGGPRASFIVQFKELQRRFYFATVRNRLVLGVRMFLAVFFGFVVGTVFFQMHFNQTEIVMRVSAVFVTLLFVMFTANAFLPDVFSARAMYFRETTADMYAAAPFYIARYTADIPFVLVECLILAVMIDYIANLGTHNTYSFVGNFYLGLLAVRWASITATYFIGYLIETGNNANTIHATYFNLLFAMCGFLIPRPDIGWWWRWFYYGNFLQWGLSFISAFMERNQLYTCDLHPANDGQVIPIYTKDVSSQVCHLDSSNSYVDPSNPSITYKCTYACGKDFLNDLGIRYDEEWIALEICLVWAFAVLFFVCAYFCIRYINHVKR